MCSFSLVSSLKTFFPMIIKIKLGCISFLLQGLITMTNDLVKDSTHCFICHIRVGTSSRNSIQIFENSTVNSSDKPLIRIICSVLQKEITPETAHSVFLCKKCYKLFNEFDELESRLTEIRSELNAHYDQTVRKIMPEAVIHDEYNDHDYIDQSDGQIVETLNLNYDEKESESSMQMKDAESIDNLSEYLVHDIDKVPMETVEYIEEDDEIVVKMETTVTTANTNELKDDSEKDEENLKEPESNVKVEESDEQIVMRDGTEYTCLLCSSDEEKVVGDAKEIVLHVKSVHDSRLYICDICGMDFKKRNELSLHMDDHVAKEEGDFQCEVCNRIFSNLRLFRIHKRIHYPQVKSWPCETCGKRYSSKNLLEEHINTHTGTRPYVCENCGKDFASKYTYKAHAKTHEVRPRPFQCSQCSKSFLSQQNLNQHERTHNGVKEYVCHQCGKAFGSHHNLEVHNIVHTGYKPYICRMCGKAFARKAEIRDHERTHTGEKPYQCEFCGATFSQRSNLQSHKRATHYNDKRYKCDDCGKGFKRRRLLDYHIKAAHTGERPYKCETCTATFVYPEHFKKHMRIHTGEKPYLCEVCGKAFNSRDNRNAHRFIHSDKKPYECLVCGMGFMRKPLLYAHMQTQGHLNDTIVVNQPRLTTDDEEVINIPEGDVELLMEGAENEQLEETELYVADLKDHVIIERNADSIYQEENVLNISTEDNVGQEETDHERVEDNAITFVDTGALDCKSDETDQQVEQVYGYNTNEDGETIVVPSTSNYKEIVTDKNSVRVVQIRIPPAVNGEPSRWLSIVQNT
ncbi:zinc finger protein 436-like isoform X2 [Venturia canescens]|uniref:zinc finger protein 436-like isoform X2 n=1 Tax=Venturia canescens TaxID=32260 RepID=UPI001C9D4F6C|nr:zinc finger protein 436-like isoform X2 [Venturia canescens]